MAQKNHTRLLDIFAALKKVRPDSCLLLVGEGELRAELEAKAVPGWGICAGCEVPGRAERHLRLVSGHGCVRDALAV